MMGKNLADVVMFISSYFPLYFFIIVLKWELFKKIFICVVELNLHIVPTWKLIFAIIIILCFAISIGSIYWVMKLKGNREYSLVGLKHADTKVIDYLFVYIIPLITLSIDQSISFFTNLFLFILIGFLYIRMQLFFLNPLWAFWGYFPYECDSGYIITNISFERLKRHNGNIYGEYISNYIFLANKSNAKNKSI